MSLTEIYNLILLIGGILMFIMSLLLWFSPKGAFHNKILGSFVFIWSFTSIIYVVQSKEFFVKFPHLFGVATTLWMLFFPLMYIYVKTFLFKEERKIKKYLIHFIPFVLFAISFSSFYLKSASEKSAIISVGMPDYVKSLFVLGDVFMILSGVLYSVLSFRVLLAFEMSHDNKLSQKVAYAFKWIRIFLILNLILLAIGTTGVGIELLEIKIPIDAFKIYFLGLTILTIGTGLFTIFNRNYFDNEPEFELIIEEPTTQKLLSQFDTKNYRLKIVTSKTQLDLQNTKNESDTGIIIGFIEKTKPFLNKDMTLQTLAEDVGFTKHHVTKILNTSIGSNFNDIVNEYRVKEVIRLINEGKHEQHKLLYLAELSGFNSKSSFNRAFKKFTGKTPSEYIQ